MKHFFYFTGYADDVVIAGADASWLDEHFPGYFLLSNGAIVHAEHCPADEPEHPGWRITCDHPSATRIPAVVSEKEQDAEHTDERIPAWLDAPGYADVIIIEADEPLEIVTQGDAPPEALTPLGVLALRVARSINVRMDYDRHQYVSSSTVEEALSAHLPDGVDLSPLLP